MLKCVCECVYMLHGIFNHIIIVTDVPRMYLYKHHIAAVTKCSPPAQI